MFDGSMIMIPRFLKSRCEKLIAKNIEMDLINITQSSFNSPEAQKISGLDFSELIRPLGAFHHTEMKQICFK